MLNPHQGLIDWLNSMSKEELENLPIMFSSNPYFSSREQICLQQNKRMDIFWQTINKYTKPSLESVDFLMVFKALIDYHYENFLNGTCWSIIENSHKKALNDPDCPPGMEAISNKILLSLPENKEKWKKLSASWEELKKGDLSNENLKIWKLIDVINDNN